MSASTQVAAEGRPNTAVARPLKILIPLIHDDLEQGRQAAARASVPHYRAAGEKLWEAKAQLAHGEFTAWVKRHFNISKVTSRKYMNLAEAMRDEKLTTVNFSSLNDFIRQTRNREQQEDAQQQEAQAKAAAKAEKEAQRILLHERIEAEVRAHSERVGAKVSRIPEFERQIIDVGYKTLAQRCHPDHGGSTDAMWSLTAARDRLKRRLEMWVL